MWLDMAFNLCFRTLTVTAKKGPTQYRKVIEDVDISSAVAKVTIYNYNVFI